MSSSEVRLTKGQIRKLHQEACRTIACAAAARGRFLCPFCPWGNKE